MFGETAVFTLYMHVIITNHSTETICSNDFKQLYLQSSWVLFWHRNACVFFFKGAEHHRLQRYLELQFEKQTQLLVGLGVRSVKQWGEGSNFDSSWREKKGDVVLMHQANCKPQSAQYISMSLLKVVDLQNRKTQHIKFTIVYPHLE